MVNMSANGRTPRLFHVPNWYVITAFLILVPIGIYAVIFTKMRLGGRRSHGVAPEIRADFHDN